MVKYIVLFVFFVGQIQAQVVNTATLDTSGGEKIGKITIGGYIDSYIGYSTTQNSAKEVPYFVSSNQHQNFNINLAYLDLRLNTERVRARLVPGFGTYINSNYVYEQGSLKHLVEANVGIKLFKSKKIWLDMGVLGSPYTNESAISKDHAMYTRSLAPEYVPYYLCGAKLTVPTSESTTVYLYILNGWQQIQDMNEQKSFGSQVEWRIHKHHLLNWNTYFGNERSPLNPDYRMRYFTDIYWLYNSGKHFSLSSCAYIGKQDVMHEKSKVWFQGNIIAKYQFNPTLSLGARAEYFSDPKQAVVMSLNDTKFNVYSGGLCLNWHVSNHAMLRLDGRSFFSQKHVFSTDTKQMYWVTSNITVWF